MSIAYAFLVFGILGLIMDSLSNFFVASTVNMLMIIIIIACCLATAAVYYAGKNRGALGLRLGGFAAALLCLAVGWLSVPGVYEGELLRKAVETEIQYNDVKIANGNYPAAKVSAWVRENEYKAMIAKLHYDYCNANSTDDSSKSAMILSIFPFALGALFLISGFYPSAIKL